MIHRSLRGRVALAAATATAVVILLGGGVVLALVSHAERSNLDERLAEQTRFVAQPLVDAIRYRTSVTEIDLEARRPDVGTIIRVYQDRTLVMPIGSKSVVLPTPTSDGYRTENTSGRSWRVLTVTIAPKLLTTPDGTEIVLQAAVPTTATDELINNLRNRVIEVALVSAVLAGIAGWFLGGASLRPLARLRATAESVSTTRDLSARVPVGSGPREVDDLASSLNIMLTRLEEAARSTDSALASSRAFAGNAAHEMRTPLTSMQANLDVLTNNPDLPVVQRQEIVESVAREQARLVALLDALHTLARGDVVGDAQRERLDLADLVGVAVDVVRRRFAEVDFTYTVPDQDIDINGWADGLRVLVDNLLINAARHGGSRVEVSVSQTDHGAELTVDDDGPGIPEDEREVIFDYFHRGRNALAPGSGLGLALVAQQAKLHHGQVVVADSPLGGARFTVTLQYD